jgi:iron complex transport system ATP-binding protein
MAARDQPTLFELVEATLVRGDRTLLHQLTLAIHRGEHTAIVGPNGAGKSALVRLLTLQDRPVVRSGTAPPVRVLGREDWDVFELRARLGLVSADLHHRFVAGNSEGRITAERAVLSGFLATHGILRYGQVTAAMRERASAALDRAGVGHLATRRLHEMSSGEARRVMLARALVVEPDVLLLDEPTTGLDLVARHRFIEAVRQAAVAGTTVVLVTHHVDELMPELVRVLLLKAGRIEVDGPPASTVTSQHLSRVFDAPLVVTRTGDRYAVALRATSPDELSARRA